MPANVMRLPDPARDLINPEELCKPRAVIDWVDVCIHLQRPTQAKHLYTRYAGLGFTHFTALDQFTGCAYPAGLGNTTTTVFVARMQDPSSVLDATDRLGAIGAEYTFTEAPEVRAFEVAVDIAPRVPQSNETDHKAQLAALAERVYRNLALPVHGDHRLLPSQRTQAPSDTYKRSRNAKLLSEGWSLFIGHKGDEQTQRIYVKDYDGSDGAGRRVKLPQSEWKVRLEVTLCGAACPFSSLDEWSEYDFARLSKDYFSARKPRTAMAVPLFVACFERRHRELRYRSRHSRFTQADSRLTDMYRVALRGLTKRQRSSRRPRCHRAIRRGEIRTCLPRIHEA